MTPTTLDGPSRTSDSEQVSPQPVAPDPRAGASADTDGSKDRVWREWLAVGEGLSGLLSVIAIIIALVALAGSGSSNSVTTVRMPAASPAAAAAAATPAVAPVAVTMAYRSDVEHGRKGPDGTWHDAATPAIYSVKAGAKVTLTLVNYDTSPHSFTAPGLGVDQIVPSGSPGSPAKMDVTFTAPTKPGRYSWYCKVPCDPWAMMHVGYMRGYVTVRA
ncbi:MAG TPA: cupredoxin domain-containing protein [Solirubrobacteraceae bacterium]|nr:cupredoxin domain-containing protein [Solirubrobacteraceae bacterium]